MVVCPSCSRAFDETGELPGSRVRCTCGAMVEVPLAAPPSKVEGPASYRDAPLEAGMLRCPACGGPCEPHRRSCLFCGVHLMAVRCPACTELCFAGSLRCSRCGVELREEKTGDSELSCPRCKVALVDVRVGETHVSECGRCGGLFVDHRTVEKVTADVERRAAFREALALRPSEMPLPELGHTNPVVYLRCPVCDLLMQRRNFARVSGVILDVCKEHGSWFDAGELTRVIDFVAAGGMEKSRRVTKEDDERRRSAERDEEIRKSLAPMTQSGALATGHSHRGDGLTDVLRWIVDIFISD